MIKQLKYVSIREIDLDVWKIKKDKPYMMISDLLRMRLLYKFGGVYSDFDMLWLRPMKEFTNIDCVGDPNDFETTVCFYGLTKEHHNASNIVSEKRGGFLLSIIKSQQCVRPPYFHQSCNSTLLNRKFPTLELITKDFPRVLAIAYHTFYPYSIFNLEQLYLKNDLTPIKNAKVMGVHWFNGHELSQQYIRREFAIDCSMTSILKQEGYL